MSDEQREAAWVKHLAAEKKLNGPIFTKRGHFNAGWKAAMAAKTEPVQIDREVVRSAIARVLVNASSYPPNIGWRILGVDMGPLINKATDAVLAALAAQPVTPTLGEAQQLQEPQSSAKDAQPVTGAVEWEYGVYDPANNEVDECGPDPVTRDSFSGIDWDATGEYIVRRRPAGPWLEVN